MIGTATATVLSMADFSTLAIRVSPTGIAAGRYRVCMDFGGDGDFSDSGPTCAWHCYSCDGVHMTDGVHTIGHGTCVSSQSWPKSERLGPAFLTERPC